MAVTDPTTVERYAMHHAQMMAMIEHLQEFIATMPAPDENGDIPGVCYGYVGDVARIHEHMKEASDLAYEMSE